MKISQHDFLGYFFGTNDYALVSVCFLYGCIGMFMMMLVDIMGRDKKSPWSDEEFRFGYFLKDNTARFLFNFLIMLVCIRFSEDFLHEPTSPKQSVLIGFFSDVIALMVKKRKQKAITDAENGKIDKLTITNTSNNNGEESSSKKEVTVQSSQSNVKTDS